MSYSKNQAGFTLVELTVVVALLGIIMVVFLGMCASFFITINRTNQLQELTITSQNLLRSTVSNIRLGDGVRQTNSITDPNAPSGGWNTDDTDFVIIIAVPAEDSSHNYIIDPSTGSPYMNELVYYKDGSTLMQRTLANPSAVNNTTQTSCPADLATTTCPADKVLADYVSSMTFSLYDQNAASTTDPTQARSVKITLAMQRDSPGNPITFSDTMRVTLRNNF